jgi:hypothetical protein
VTLPLLFEVVPLELEAVPRVCLVVFDGGSDAAIAVSCKSTKDAAF